MVSYKIVRYYSDGRRRAKIMRRGLTLKQAQKHCQNPKTRGKTWFDGYTKE